MALGYKPRWRKQETEIAKRFKGKKTKQSGGGYQKGDVRSELVIIEAKSTKFKSFSVTERLINKLEKDAFGADKIPAIAVELENGKRKFYIIPDYCIELLLGLKCS